MDVSDLTQLGLDALGLISKLTTGVVAEAADAVIATVKQILKYVDLANAKVISVEDARTALAVFNARIATNDAAADLALEAAIPSGPPPASEPAAPTAVEGNGQPPEASAPTPIDDAPTAAIPPAPPAAASKA